MTRNDKTKNSAYSALYSTSIENHIYEKEGTYVNLREPFKGCKLLREKIINKYDNNFVTKLGPEDRMNVPPVKLVIEEELKDALDGKVLAPCANPSVWSSNL